MSDGTAAVGRSRLRTWIVLAAMVAGLLSVSALCVWIWLRSDGDIRAVEEEATALGINLNPPLPSLTDPVRMAQAKLVEAKARALLSGAYVGAFSWHRGLPLTQELRTKLQEASTQEVCEFAQTIIDLGSDPIVLSGPVRPFMSWSKIAVLQNRMLVAEPVELELCLAAMQVQIDMALRERQSWWAWTHLQDFCGRLPYRMSDQRERLRPLTAWLDAKAMNLLEDLPRAAEELLIQDLSLIRKDDEFFRVRGMQTPTWMSYPTTMAITMRLERERLLRAELSWHVFLATHRMQPQVWMAEANHRSAALVKEGSWLGAHLHAQALFLQHPYTLRRMVGIVLHARLLAAELRGSPWPVDLLDPAGNPLRRWEKDGRLIGAYSVGENGVDDGGDGRRDITLRLYLEPESSPAP